MLATEPLAERAVFLILTGRSEEALPALEQAIELDPRSPNVPSFLHWKCRAHLNLGHYDDAIDACEKALGLDDSWSRYLPLIAAHVQKGNPSRADTAKAALFGAPT